MDAICKLTGEQTTWPCATAGCPLFGDCLAAWQTEFAKPKTNGDKVRAMSDEELADVITALMSKQRTAILEQLHALGLIPDVTIVEAPIMARAAHLKWLKEPAERG